MEPIHVISLARSIERRKAFAEYNASVDYSFFDAVDGAALPASEKLKVVAPGEHIHYSTGAVGCALSHRALWQRAVDKQIVLTIAEDDAIFRADFHDAHDALLRRTAPDWDIIVLGWNFDSMLSLDVLTDISPMCGVFNEKHLRSTIDRFVASRQKPALLKLDKVMGTPAYTVSPAGAAKLLGACFPLTSAPVRFAAFGKDMPNNGIDIAMCRVYPEMNAYVCLPPLAVTKNERASSTTIHHATRHTS